MNARPAKIRFTYNVHRHDRYSVSAPPRSRPTAPPAPAIAPNTPNALPRSFCPVNVVVSSDSADGTSSAANAPWHARAVTSITKLTEAPPTADTPAKPARPVKERHLLAQQVGQPPGRAAAGSERQGVRGEHPLPVHGSEMQSTLRRRQRDVHHRDIEDHHSASGLSECRVGLPGPPGVVEPIGGQAVPGLGEHWLGPH